MGAEKQLERDLLIAALPEDVTRVKVIDEKGTERWRSLSDILPMDELVVVGGKVAIMKGNPGRKPRPPIPKMPPASSQVVADLQAAKQYRLETDPLMVQLEESVDDDAILYHVMRGLAEESVSLLFERHEAEREGKETSAVSIRRVNALRTLADTYLKRKEQLSAKMIDLSSPAFTRLFQFMLDTFRDAMSNGGISRDQVETVFTQLAKRMADDPWEQEARMKMKGA
jgi:hypothetical protein